MVTDGAGEVGFGQEVKRKQNLAVKAATWKVHRQRFHLASESWDLGNVRTIPFHVISTYSGGIRVHLKPT